VELLNVALGVLQDDALREIAMQANNELLDQLSGLTGVEEEEGFTLSDCGRWFYDRFSPFPE
jgi:hypothetical protein